VVIGNDSFNEDHRIVGCYAAFVVAGCRLLVTANIVPSSPILVTLIAEMLQSPGTSVLTRAT
jgi:hypothetical protein